MPYTSTTLSSLISELAAALGDPAMRFWSQDELESLVRESISCWNCHTAYFRKEGTFNLAGSANTFYDLTLTTPKILTPLPDESSILNSLQFALLEPFFSFSSPSEFSSFPTTEMFRAPDIYNALRRAITQFNFDSGVMFSVEPPITLPSPPQNPLLLNEAVCDVRRVSLRNSSNFRWTLSRQDELETQHRSSPEDLISFGPTQSYSYILSPQPGIRLFPWPQDTGFADIISIRSTSLPPKDIAWAVKWLALHYLLSQDGQSRDHFRAQYALKRYQDSLLLARMLPSYMIAYINGRPASISPISDEDRWNPGWENVTPTTPQTLLSLGWNLIGLSPRPSPSISISVRLDGVVDSQIPPLTPATPIQLAPEHIQVILGYAQHVALFKLGGSEFAQSTHFYEEFFRAAIEYNSKLAVESKNFWLMRDRAARDKEHRRARREDITSIIAEAQGGQ